LKMQWKKTALAAALMFGAFIAVDHGARADEVQPASVRMESHPLTDRLEVQLKSLYNEKVPGGVRAGAVVRLTNTSDRLTRVPDYELRIVTDDGAEYTLSPSASNARSVQPKSKVELSYLTTIDREDDVVLSELTWVDVDVYVYPKQETKVLTLPISPQDGEDGGVSDGLAASIAWGDAFVLPFEEPPLRYTAVDLAETSNEQGPVVIVKVLVENPNDEKRAVSDFAIDGKSERKTYKGNRIEQGDIVVEPGEKRYVHFVIPTESGAQLTGLTVVTPERFIQAEAQGQAAAIAYTVDRFHISLPDSSVASERARLPYYAFGQRISFDPVNKLVDPRLAVSLADLRLYQNENAGYQTAVARFRIENTGETPLPVPAFAAELLSSNGFRYAGVANNAQAASAPPQIMPNSSALVAYSFLLPDSDTGDLSVKLFDAVSIAPYKTAIAAFNVALLPEMTNLDPISFYPFEVTIKDWDFYASMSAGMAATMYSYRVKLNLDIRLTDNVALGQDIPKLEVELEDRNGVVMASQAIPFVGPGKLISGPQTISLDNVGYQLESGIKINIYERIDTANGPAKRLVAEFRT